MSAELQLTTLCEPIFYFRFDVLTGHNGEPQAYNLLLPIVNPGYTRGAFVLASLPGQQRHALLGCTGNSPIPVISH